MNRRTLLAAVASGSLPAGCGGRQPSDSTPAEPSSTSATLTSQPTPVADEDTLASLGFPSTIYEAEILTNFHIHAIVDPAFGLDWDGLLVDGQYYIGFEGPRLPDEAPVVDVDREGAAQAYPIAVVWWYEVVNDSLGGPLLVTYCPICSSGMVAERLVEGEETVFGVSGQLWQPPGEYAVASIDAGTVFGAYASRADA